ncbi:MAG: hypothetical protein ACLPKE_23320 [Streptosporangiaceae bacterium]
MADGAGVPTEAGDAVGTTVGCGVWASRVVLLSGAGLVDVTRAVDAGVVAGWDVEGTAVDEPAGCAGAGETAALDGLRYT